MDGTIGKRHGCVARPLLFALLILTSAVLFLLVLRLHFKTQEPYGRILTFFVTSTLDRGWSMTLSSALPIVLFALALTGVTRADNQQAQQSSVNAAICLLAVRSRSLPDRRSDLQARHTDLACCQRLYLIGSGAVDLQFPDGVAMRTSAALSFVIFLATLAVAQAEDEVITVGPWTIAASSKADKFDSCTMSRSTDDLNVSFVRADDGLALLLDSSKWRLERGRAYEVTLVAGQRSVDARALAETRGVTIPLADRPLNEAMRTANVLEVRGEGTTLRVPLDGSIAALARLEACFVNNSRVSSDTNPFVAPNRKQSSQAQYDERKTRNGVVKCYRNFVIGRYRCHRFY